jgi:hypothetical protein
MQPFTIFFGNMEILQIMKFALAPSKFFKVNNNIYNHVAIDRFMYGTISKDLAAAESYVLDQALSSLSLFSLSSGDYITAVDCSRFVIKERGQSCEPEMWLLRGLSFLGMGMLHLFHFLTVSYRKIAFLGVPYLCSLHFKSALGHGNQNPSLLEVISYLDQVELEEAKMLMTTPFEVLEHLFYNNLPQSHPSPDAICFISINFPTQWLVEFQLIRTLNGCFNQYNEFLRENANFGNINMTDCKVLVNSSVLFAFIQQQSNNHEDSEQPGVVENERSFMAYISSYLEKVDLQKKTNVTTFTNRLLSMLQQHSAQHGLYIIMYVLAHRLFYEAQVRSVQCCWN